MVRAPFFDKNGLKKGAWSQEEDDKLKAYVERYGHWNWRELPKFAGLSRCGKSCRLRWLNYLKPGVKHGNFCREEDDLIIKYHEKNGNRWSLIAAKLPGRSDNEVKNYWHTHLKKKLKKEHSNLCVTSDSQEMVSTVQNTEQEAVVNVPCHPILESCTSSADEDSCSISTNCYSSEMILQDEQLPTSGDFWTEPFIEDKYTFDQDSCADLLSFRDSDLEFVPLHNYPSCEDTIYGFEFNDNGQF